MLALCVPVVDWCAVQSGPRQESYRYAVAPGNDDKKQKRKKGKENLDDLKQELTMDEHKIPIQELYDRLGSHPDMVRSLLTMLLLLLLLLHCHKHLRMTLRRAGVACGRRTS